MAPLLPKVGMLDKQSQLLGVWQPRRVELSEGSFRYFKDGCREPRGVLSRHEVRGVEGELPSTICIHTSLAGGEDRTYRYHAPGGEDDMRAWVKCFAAAFDLEDGEIHPERSPARSRNMTSSFGTAAVAAAFSSLGYVGSAFGQVAKVAGGEEWADKQKQWAGDKVVEAKRAWAQTRESLEEQMESALTNCDEGTTQTLLDKAVASGLTGDKMPAVVRRAARRIAGRHLRDATVSGDPKRLKGALVAAKRLQCAHVPEFEPALCTYKHVRQIPAGWDLGQMLAERKHGASKLHAKADVSHDYALRNLVQFLFDATFSQVSTRDRRYEQVPRRLEVVRVQEVRNESQWVDYMVRREEVIRELQERRCRGTTLLVDADTDTAFAQVAATVALRGEDPENDPCAIRAVVPLGAKPGDEVEFVGSLEDRVIKLRVPEGSVPGKEATFLEPLAANLPGPPLETFANEVVLFHGTKPIAAEKITSDDFCLDLAGSSAGTLYGRGIYLAESCTKADEYSHQDPSTGLFTMLLCRATLGKLLYNAEVNPDPRKCEDACMKGDYHSVLGDRKACRGTYREFVVFDEDQVYPNYIVHYRRLCSGS